MADKAEVLECSFTEELLQKLDAAALICRQERLRANIGKYGGVSCVKELLRRGRRSDGFDALAAAGRLELSAEALAAEGKYGALFTDEEVNACFAALCDAGYYRFAE